MQHSRGLPPRLRAGGAIPTEYPRFLAETGDGLDSGDEDSALSIVPAGQGREVAGAEDPVLRTKGPRRKRRVAAPTTDADVVEETLNARGFFFRERRAKLNLRLISRLDVDRIEAEADIDALQGCLENLTFARLTEAELECVTDESFLKLFRLAQMTIEYLLAVQETLAANVEELAQRYHAKKEAVAARKTVTRQQKDRIRELQRSVSEKNRAIAKLEQLVVLPPAGENQQLLEQQAALAASEAQANEREEADKREREAYQAQQLQLLEQERAERREAEQQHADEIAQLQQQLAAVSEDVESKVAQALVAVKSQYEQEADSQELHREKESQARRLQYEEQLESERAERRQLEEQRAAEVARLQEKLAALEKRVDREVSDVLSEVQQQQRMEVADESTTTEGGYSMTSGGVTESKLADDANQEEKEMVSSSDSIALDHMAAPVPVPTENSASSSSSSSSSGRTRTQLDSGELEQRLNAERAERREAEEQHAAEVARLRAQLHEQQSSLDTKIAQQVAAALAQASASGQQPRTDTNDGEDGEEPPDSDTAAPGGSDRAETRDAELEAERENRRIAEEQHAEEVARLQNQLSVLEEKMNIKVSEALAEVQQQQERDKAQALATAAEQHERERQAHERALEQERRRRELAEEQHSTEVTHLQDRLGFLEEKIAQSQAAMQKQLQEQQQQQQQRAQAHARAQAEQDSRAGELEEDSEDLAIAAPATVAPAALHTPHEREVAEREATETSPAEQSAEQPAQVGALEEDDEEDEDEQDLDTSDSSLDRSADVAQPAVESNDGAPAMPLVRPLAQTAERLANPAATSPAATGRTQDATPAVADMEVESGVSAGQEPTLHAPVVRDAEDERKEELGDARQAETEPAEAEAEVPSVQAAIGETATALEVKPDRTHDTEAPTVSDTFVVAGHDRGTPHVADANDNPANNAPPATAAAQSVPQQAEEKQAVVPPAHREPEAIASIQSAKSALDIHLGEDGRPADHRELNVQQAESAIGQYDQQVLSRDAAARQRLDSLRREIEAEVQADLHRTNPPRRAGAGGSSRSGTGSATPPSTANPTDEVVHQTPVVAAFEDDASELSSLALGESNDTFEGLDDSMAASHQADMTRSLEYSRNSEEPSELLTGAPLVSASGATTLSSNSGAGSGR